MSKAPIKLLIADDEDNVRNGIATYMRLKCTTIDKIYEASNGIEALELIFKHEPALMLIDIHMPYKDGLTVMKEALAAGICPKTIILSGHDEFKYAQQGIRYGIVDYLLKPCRPMDILSKVENMVEEKEVFQREHDASQKKQVSRFVELATEYMSENFAKNLTLTSVADVAGITPTYLSTLFRQTLCCGFVDYLNKIRVDIACNFLHDPQLRTYEVAYKVGFNDEKYFSKVFKKLIGLSPSEFRRTNYEDGTISENKYNSSNFIK